MDNRIFSQIKRGFKVTINYLMVLVVFAIFAMPIVGIADANISAIMPFVSFLLFLFLFFSVYVEMRNIAFKEKRPHYQINPSPFKGLLYGFIGSLPLAAVQGVFMLLQVPEDYTVLVRRLYQGFSGPLYWFAKLLGNDPVHYLLSLILVIVISGLGYFAGHKEFYLVAFIRKKLGIKTKAEKKKEAAGQKKHVK